MLIDKDSFHIYGQREFNHASSLFSFWFSSISELGFQLMIVRIIYLNRESYKKQHIDPNKK